MSFDIKKTLKLVRFLLSQRGIYPSITDIDNAMNTLVQERHNHSGSCKTNKVSRKTQRVVIYLAKEGSGLAFFKTVLGHLNGSKVYNEIGAMSRETGSHNPKLWLRHCLHTHSYGFQRPD